MGDDERPRLRRRTAFEQDLRELVLKVGLALVVGVVLRVWTGSDGWLAPMLVGFVAVFWIAALIRGSSRHAD